MKYLIVLSLCFFTFACGTGEQSAHERVAASATPVTQLPPGDKNSTIDALHERMKHLIDSPDTSLQELANRSQETASGELSKLRQFEYRVVTFPLDAADASIEAKLNALGQEFWECFDTERTEISGDGAIRVFCRRRPDTPLRFVPSTILGR